jgi:DNA repair protein RadC
MNADDTDFSGHRARIRERLLTQGPDALLDHELVEYLLALVTPRRDTKPKAWALIKEFGGLGPLFAADGETPMRAGLSETAAAAIKIAEASALRLLKSKIDARPVLSGWQAVIDYLIVDMAHCLTERVRVLHLNSRNELIRDELVSEGSIDQAAVYVREVIKRALDLGSAAIILVHNHPSGDPSPSKQDIELTRQIIVAGKPLGIVVHDHVIIGRESHSSMRSKGLI